MGEWVGNGSPLDRINTFLGAVQQPAVATARNESRLQAGAPVEVRNPKTGTAWAGNTGREDTRGMRCTVGSGGQARTAQQIPMLDRAV